METGTPTYASYYRERKVNKKAFYAELKRIISSYNILEEDVCGWQNNAMGQAERTEKSGFRACRKHLRQSFEIEDRAGMGRS